MDIVAYLTPIAASAGVLLSLLSIIYTKQQNARRLDVDLEFNDSKFREFEDPTNIFLELSAFNSGYRSVALIGYEFLVNNEVIIFDINDSYPDPHQKGINFLIRPRSNNILPYSLKEG
jgi:hypothetical protein